MILLNQKPASVLYACSLPLLTFVCLPHPRSAWLTLNHAGCWLPGFNLSVIIFWCFHILLSDRSGDTCTFLSEVFMVANAPPICADADVSWYLRAQEQLLSTALNRKSSEKFLLMEGQRVPLSYVHLSIIYHQIFFHLECLGLSCWFETSKNKLKMNMELNRGNSVQIHWAHTHTRTH